MSLCSLISLLLLGLMLVITAHARTYQSLSRRGYHGGQGRQGGSGGHGGAGNPAACDQAIGECSVLALQYMGDPSAFQSLSGTGTFIRSKTLRSHCTSLTEIFNCVNKVVTTALACSYLEGDLMTSTILEVVGGMLNYVCVTKFNDLNNTFGCYSNQVFIQTFYDCPQWDRYDPMTCDGTPLETCVSNSILAAGSPCKTGNPQNVANDLIAEFFKFMPFCNANGGFDGLFPGGFDRLFKRFF